MTGVMDGPGDAGSRNPVYELLQNQILSMELLPQDMLSENALSAQLNVGRPLVRDALAQLAEEGYIVVYPQRGTEVSLLDTQRIKQAVHAHMVLEQAVIREICSRELTDRQSEQLEEVLNLQKGKDSKSDTIELLALEQKFHYLLSLFCGKEYIWNLFRTLDCDLLRVDYLRYSTFNYQVYMNSLTNWENTQVEERLLLDNIRRKESEAATLIWTNHFSTVFRNVDALRGIYPQYFARED